MTWYCLSTDRHMERRVAHEITRAGHLVWLPEEFHFRLERRRAPARTWHVPILPQTLFAAIPSPAHRLLNAIQGFDTIWRDEAAVALPVPDSDISRFMAEIEARNVGLQRYFHRLCQGKLSKKPERYQGFDELRAALERKASLAETQNEV
jgi:hypothetical protein